MLITHRNDEEQTAKLKGYRSATLFSIVVFLLAGLAFAIFRTTEGLFNSSTQPKQAKQTKQTKQLK